MNKILSVLLILFTTLIAQAQDRGPAAGDLGSTTKREYVQIEKTSNFDIVLDDSGQGETFVTTEVRGGIVEMIEYKGRRINPENFYSLGTDHCGYNTRLDGNDGVVRVTVKWTTKGDGDFRFRQENSVDCYDEDFSIYYTKVIEWDYFTFGLGGLFGVCAGEEGILNVYFGGKEEWADDETRTFSLLGYNNVKIERTLSKSDIGHDLKPTTDYGFRYVLKIKLVSPSNIKKGEDYIVNTESLSVVMKNGANTNDHIKKITNRDKIYWMITPIPEENPIKHN